MTVKSGVQSWHNIVTKMEQFMKTDVTTTFHAWKSAKDNDANISSKTNWKPTFQWEQDDLILKAVSEKYVYTRDAFYRVQPLSTFAIQLEFALQFGLIQKDKNDKYHSGPNVEYELESSELKENKWIMKYQWKRGPSCLSNNFMYKF